MGPVGGTAKSEKKQGRVLPSKAVVSERTLPGHKSKTVSKSSVKVQGTMTSDGNRQLKEDRVAAREHHVASVARYPGMKIFQGEPHVHDNIHDKLHGDGEMP
jgi:hypothetical protein